MSALTTPFHFMESFQVWLAVSLAAGVLAFGLAGVFGWVRRGGPISGMAFAALLAGGYFCMVAGSRWHGVPRAQAGFLLGSFGGFLIGSVLAWASRGTLLRFLALIGLLAGAVLAWMFFGSLVRGLGTPPTALSSGGLVASAAGLALGVVLTLADWRSCVAGFGAAASRVAGLFYDLFAMSPRRIGAIAWHSFWESVRRRILLVFLLFGFLFLFAGWYLPTRPTDHVKVYVSFVLMSATLIAVVASVLIAATSLPNDIRFQTIHTVVTKPVRRLEIVLGRVLGFTILATGMLAAMGAFSYVYLVRSVHGSLDKMRSELARLELRDESGRVTSYRDVAHADRLKDDIKQIETKLTARAPVFGQLLFRDEKGQFKATSKYVGYESTERSYIEGNTLDAAIWYFSNVQADELIRRGEIPIELTFTVFRTTKGEIGKGVVAQLIFKNPETQVEIADYPFEVREYYVNRQVLRDSPGNSEKSIAHLLEKGGGKLIVEARCLSPTQYLGMSQTDLYILRSGGDMDDAAFGFNFLKALVGVWLSVFLIICVAVTASTFLSAMVAILATAAVFIAGYWMPFLREVAAGKALGGGPTEAIIRLVTHENLQRTLDPNIWVRISLGADRVLRVLLTGLTYVLPDLGNFNTSHIVANGFDISGPLLTHNVLAALGYAIPFILVGYFLLESREIAR